MNPAMPGLVKIGVTERDDPQERIQQLFATNVPLPFDLEYAAAADLPPRQVERALHTAFAPQRVHADREFYRIDPEQAIAEGRVDSLAKITADLFGYEYMSALHHRRLEDGRLLKDVYEEAHAAD